MPCEILVARGPIILGFIVLFDFAFPVSHYHVTNYHIQRQPKLAKRRPSCQRESRIDMNMVTVTTVETAVSTSQSRKRNPPGTVSTNEQPATNAANAENQTKSLTVPTNRCTIRCSPGAAK